MILKANAIGHNSKAIKEFLEKNYKSEMDDKSAIKLALKGLLEIVQTGGKNIDIAVMTKDLKLELLSTEAIEELVKELEKEKELEAERKKISSSSRMEM